LAGVLGGQRLPRGHSAGRHVQPSALRATRNAEFASGTPQ
jgi:hypothetical protein